MNVKMKFLRRYIIGSASAVPDLFTYYDVDSNNLSTEKYIGQDITATVPPTHNGKSVVQVGSDTFMNNDTITNVIISNGFEKIK